MRTIILVILAILLSQCSTMDKSKGPVTDVGVWQGKILIKNTKTKKNKWASLIWASDSKNDRMKVNVSAIMDYPVAAFLRKDDQNDLWLFTENKHYRSVSGERLFQSLLKVSIDPKIFYSLLGNPQSPGNEWNCKKDSDTFNCHSVKLKTKFSVDISSSNRRVIKINKGQKALQISLSRSKVQVTEKHFSGLNSSQFKTIEI